MSYLLGTKSFWTILAVVFVRYLVLAAIPFLMYYVFRRNAWQFKKIQTRFPVDKDYGREILYSVVTSLIFAGVGYLVFLTPFVRLTKVYFTFSDHSLLYFFISVLAIIITHDTYFYWMHRLIHHKAIYRLVHKVHHLSTNPSPWAAMAFHPLEAVLEAGIIVLVAFLFPIHPLAIAIFLLFMMLYNVYGHLGYEMYPKGFSTSKVGRWINTSVNHNMHHQYFTGNYGLYFLFWDRWMGTLRSDYDAHFQEVKARKKPLSGA